MIDRLEFELNTIIKMGYVNYYLIVFDFIDYAKSVRYSCRAREEVPVQAVWLLIVWELQALTQSVTICCLNVF